MTNLNKIAAEAAESRLVPTKFRKKPVQIEALQLAPEGVPGVSLRQSWDALTQFTHFLVRHTGPVEDDFDWLQFYVFDRLHDTWVEFERGDWIIKGVQGEYYPIKPDVLEQTYERVGVR